MGIGDASLSKIFSYSIEHDISIFTSCRAMISGEACFSLNKKQTTALGEFVNLITDLRSNLEFSDIQGIVIKTIQKTAILNFLKKKKNL